MANAAAAMAPKGAHSRECSAGRGLPLSEMEVVPSPPSRAGSECKHASLHSSPTNGNVEARAMTYRVADAPSSTGVKVRGIRRERLPAYSNKMLEENGS